MSKKKQYLKVWKGYIIWVKWVFFLVLPVITTQCRMLYIDGYLTDHDIFSRIPCLTARSFQMEVMDKIQYESVERKEMTSCLEIMCLSYIARGENLFGSG